MRIFEIIIDRESTIYNADILRAVSKESSTAFENCFWVNINAYPLEPIRILLASESMAEKLYLSIKAFMKSDSDEELTIQLKEGSRAKKLVAIQTVKKYKNATEKYKKHSEKSYRKNRWATPKKATEKIGGSGGLRERVFGGRIWVQSRTARVSVAD